MNAVPEDVLCPVLSFRLYVARLHPSQKTLRQRPHNTLTTTTFCWFQNKPVGCNTAGTWMVDISTAAGLSRICTNHYTRATTITNFSRAGCDGRFIRQISGHGSNASLALYCQQITNEQKGHMPVSLMNSAGVFGAPLEQPASTEILYM